MKKTPSIIMVWAEKSTPGGQAVNTLSIPPIALVEIDGIVLAKRPAD